MFRPTSVRDGALQLVSFVTLATVALTGSALAQDHGEAPDMGAMMAAATPGPHHKQMAKQAGVWKTTSKMWMAPGEAPMETAGTATMSVLMDGRFVQEVSKATMMGMPWEGRGIFGYDNSTKKHVGTWFDSFGTMMMSFEGSCDGTCNVVTLKSTYFDPMSKSTKVMKSVSTTKSDDHAVTELFDVADGKETKMVEITYEREGQAKR